MNTLLGAIDIGATMPRPTIITRGFPPTLVIVVNGKEKWNGRNAAMAGDALRKQAKAVSADWGPPSKVLADARWYAGDGLTLVVEQGLSKQGQGLSKQGLAVLTDARTGREMWKGPVSEAVQSWHGAMREWGKKHGPHKSATVGVIWGKPGKDKTVALYGQPPF